jgi:hypothetical protein
MDRNKIPVAMLAAVAMCGSMSMASYAQPLMVSSPVPVTPAAVTAVPHVSNSRSKPAATQQMPQPTKKPFAATGRILHVQNAQNAQKVQKNSIKLLPPSSPLVAPVAMSMGGFATARVPIPTGITAPPISPASHQ